MQIPDDVIKNVKNGTCILFLGAMVSAPSPPGSRYQYTQCPPSGTELSQWLAEKCRYPYEDKTNLQRVSLFCECRAGGSRHSLIECIKEEISKPKIVPSAALHMLAALPFPIVITTNYDHLFDIALSRANTLDGRPKQPLKQVYDPTRDSAPEYVPLDPTEELPILLKLHGDIDRPESLVITEEDYIVFIQRMSDPHLHPIHSNIQARMNSWPILFIGYSLKDYNLRLLFRTLRWHLDPARFPLSFAVDPAPDNLIVSVWQQPRPKPMVSFVEVNLWDFVPELYQAVKGVEYHA